MRRSVLALLVLACRPDAAEPPVTAGDPQAASPPTNTTPGQPASPPPANDVIDRDLDLMIGGNFTADHLGPDVHGEILARALGHAEAYAQRLRAGHAARARREPVYADLYVASALARLYPRAPDGVALSARMFLDAFGVLLHGAALDHRRRERLGEQISQLKILAGGIDRASQANASAVRPDRVCVVATPERIGVMPELDCTCGESFACRIDRRGDALELTFEKLPGPSLCDDCFPGWTTCTTGRLAPDERVRVTLGGRELGELTANASGWLPVGTCLRGG